MRGIDSHCHVFTAPGVCATTPARQAFYAPPALGVDDHAAHLARVGCDRGVLVQPSAYGQDHECLLAALRSRPAHLRGVACLQPAAPHHEVEEMHAAGVRGTRLQDGYTGGVPVDALREVAERVAPFGWHLEIWSDLRRHLDWLGEAIRRCPVPVVIDHLGYLPSDVGVDHPSMRSLVELLADGEIWVTLSGVERLLPAGTTLDPRAPGFAGVWQRHEEAIAERVRVFVETRPENLLWGSDWPHVGLELPAPDGAEVRARLDRWVTDAAIRERILTDNPARLYDFG